MKVSIIVPIYNVEKYIHKCINSLINQTYKNLEIILVDDGSPDNCGYICDEYARRDSRIKVIHKKNGGLSNARNKGVEIATGDYVMYLDSDDYLELTACEELNNIIQKTQADIVCFNLKKVNEDGKTIITSGIYNQGNTKELKEMTYQEAMIDNLYRRNIRYEAGSKIYKREIVEKVQFPEGMLAEDFATFYKFLYKANKIIFYSRCLYNYVQRNGSIMKEKSDKLYNDIYQTEKERYILLKDICKHKEECKQMESVHFRNLSKIYAKLYNKVKYEKINQELKNQLNDININLLYTRDKILYIIYKFNTPFFLWGMKKIYKKL